jgi:hypothetical protein
MQKCQVMKRMKRPYNQLDVVLVFGRLNMTIISGTDARPSIEVIDTSSYLGFYDVMASISSL